MRYRLEAVIGSSVCQEINRLLFQQVGLQENLVGWNRREFKQGQQFFLLFGSHHVKGCSVIELFPKDAVDVTRHQMNLRGVHRIKICAFRNDAPDERMVLFCMRLLPGSLRIAEEDARTRTSVSGIFHALGVFELDAIVRQDDREELAEQVESKELCKVIKHVQDTDLCTLPDQEDQHEVWIVKVQCQKHLSAA